MNNKFCNLNNLFLVMDKQLMINIMVVGKSILEKRNFKKKLKFMQRTRLWVKN